MRLPAGPEKEQFERWRHDIIAHICEAMTGIERAVAALPREQRRGQQSESPS
jgi:hypothetical protein